MPMPIRVAKMAAVWFWAQGLGSPVWGRKCLADFLKSSQSTLLSSNLTLETSPATLNIKYFSNFRKLDEKKQKNKIKVEFSTFAETCGVPELVRGLCDPQRLCQGRKIQTPQPIVRHSVSFALWKRKKNNNMIIKNFLKIFYSSMNEKKQQKKNMSCRASRQTWTIEPIIDTILCTF